MKILFSTDQIYLHGGIEKVMAEKANYFADVMGYEVFILTTEQKNNPPCYPLSKNISLLDLSVNYIRTKSYFHPLNISKIPTHFSRFIKTIETINPDIIITCNYAFDFYWLPFTFVSIPKIKEFHSSRYFENEIRKKTTGIRRLKYLLNDFIESKFTRLVLLNPDELDFYPSPNKVVIPNPITLRDHSDVQKRKKQVIAAGRIAPVKRFDLMIEAWKKVIAASPDWHLVIFGDGEPAYVDYLRQIIVDNYLEHNVFLQPATPQLQDEFLQSSFYLMTSKTECYPMVLLEAMSCGLPIVTYDSPTGPRNIVTHEFDGFIVPYDNESVLVEKIVFLTQNEPLRHEMGIKAVSKAASFSVEKVMVQWLSLIKELKQKH
ncbi:glycosyltransferase family 4 protein [Flavobacterium piscinae]|uniref:Glycosyltransferase family 4 protein n=1 Tax=Flavobacterium piscinae TaxID=2506424 RepID=A0A4V1N3C3_9FLAO|nr:glycosyltransferase family 4 protein [Flavobacterium piscinae]RXR27728.1 glycosyltransferase family 4 protein [Flavobacterium piscinae]